MRLVDDRRGEQRAGDAMIGDGERPALDLVRLEFPGAGADGRVPGEDVQPAVEKSRNPDLRVL